MYKQANKIIEGEEVEVEGITFVVVGDYQRGTDGGWDAPGYPSTFDIEAVYVEEVNVYDVLMQSVIDRIKEQIIENIER